MTEVDKFKSNYRAFKLKETSHQAGQPFTHKEVWREVQGRFPVRVHEHHYFIHLIS